jgi:hypothetical protein
MTLLEYSIILMLPFVTENCIKFYEMIFFLIFNFLFHGHLHDLYSSVALAVISVGTPKVDMNCYHNDIETI